MLDIAEVAEKTGLAPSALRFYEKKGLLSSSGRNGLRRIYEPEVLHRLELINCARRAGFSIAEIRRFLGATSGDAAVRARMAEKVVALDEDIARLQRMRDSLEHASTCTHEVLVECPDFKRALRAADSGTSAGASPRVGGAAFGADEDDRAEVAQVVAEGAEPGQ